MSIRRARDASACDESVNEINASIDRSDAGHARAGDMVGTPDRAPTTVPVSEATRIEEYLPAHVFADTVLRFLDCRSIRALSLSGTYGRDATTNDVAYGERVARRWGAFPKSVTFDRRAYIRLVAATEELTRDEKRDGDDDDVWKRAAVDALLGVVCAMERAVAMDSYEFTWCYPGEEYTEEDMDEFAECEAAGLCPPMLRSYCGENGDMGVRELAHALSDRRIGWELHKQSTTVRAALLAREVVVKTRGFGIHDAEGDNRVVRFLGGGNPFSKIEWMLVGSPKERGPFILAFTSIISNLIEGPGPHVYGMERNPQDVRPVDREGFSPEEFATWSLKSYLNAPEACHVIAPLSLMLYSTPSDRLFPASRVGMGPFTIGSRPTGSARRRERLFVGEPTTIRELDGGYVGFRYPCDIQRLVFGMRDDLYLDAQGSVFFKLQLFVPPSCEPKRIGNKGDARGDASGDASGDTSGDGGASSSSERKTHEITAILEDGLGEAKMRGIVFITEDDALRFVLRGRYARNPHRGSTLGMIGSIGPTGISGLVTKDNDDASEVFTMWSR